MGRLHTGTTLLTELFLAEVRKFEKDKSGRFECPQDYKGRIVQEAEDLLRRGVSFQRMKELLESSEEKDRYSYSLVSFLKEKGIAIPPGYRYPKPENECIQMGAFYFHPELQEASPPHRTVLDWETMEMVVQPAGPFFLEIKDSFTLEDVARYFLRETKKEEELHDVNRLVGQFRTAVGRYGLDMTLYLIDAGVAHSHDENARMPRSLGDLINTLDEAKEMYGNRRTISWDNDLYHIHPKTERKEEES